AELSELWPHPQLTLLVEDGLLKHDLGWKRLFENLKYQAEFATAKAAAVEQDYKFFLPKTGPAPYPAKLSASRLQDFLDCPRRYHADRIEKIIPRVEATLELEPMALGTIEHSLVEIGWT